VCTLYPAASDLIDHSPWLYRVRLMGGRTTGPLDRTSTHHICNSFIKQARAHCIQFSGLVSSIYGMDEIVLYNERRALAPIWQPHDWCGGGLQEPAPPIEDKPGRIVQRIVKTMTQTCD
jgi:hypothetical protein